MSRSILGLIRTALFLPAALWLLLGAGDSRAAPLEREPAYRDNFYDVAVRGPICWIVGYYGTILRSTDRGQTWELEPAGTHEALFRVAFTDDRQGWIVGSYGTVLHTTDGGKSWRPQSAPTKENLLGLDFFNERLGWAVGGGGTILRTRDGGASWGSRGIGEDVILNDVRFLTRELGWAAGEFGRIYRSRDGGLTWRKQPSPIEVSFISGESRELFRLLFPDLTDGWAFGLDGVILRDRQGKEWRVVRRAGAAASAADRHHLFSASAFGANQWAVGERGTILAAPLESDDWAPAGPRVPPASLNGIAFGRDGLGFIVGNKGTILRTENGGRDWRLMRIASAAPGIGVVRLP